jgi:uncharacterized cupredoxin-like copper-binding protein
MRPFKRVRLRMWHVAPTNGARSHRVSSPAPGRRLIAIACVLLPILATGCGSAREVARGQQPIAVGERDFKISMPATLPAGEVTLRVHNLGPDRHEFIAARVAVDGRGLLPLRSDGLTLNEEQLARSEVGELEPGQPGSLRTLHLHLAPGRYLFFCNMAGHYLGGMHQEVVVQ